MHFVHAKHQFAFFIENSIEGQFQIVIDDPLVYHRVVHVLKCQIGTTVELFNIQEHTQAILIDITKKQCIFSLASVKKNLPVQPSITLGLPLLKGSDLDEAVSFAAQVGVSAIQLLITNYTQRKLNFTVEYKRLFRLIIAAAEQSKQFAMPSIKEQIPFTDIKTRYSDHVLLFGQKNGINVHELYKECFIKNKQKSFFFMIGPEADFSSLEYEQLVQWNAKGFCLGPTVLRSYIAAGLGVGYIRALTYSQ